jgi:hypothetical protein
VPNFNKLRVNPLRRSVGTADGTGHRAAYGDGVHTHRHLAPRAFAGVVASIFAGGALVHGLWVALVPLLLVALLGDVFPD